jgi:hypothetical protein
VASDAGYRLVHGFVIVALVSENGSVIAIATLIDFLTYFGYFQDRALPSRKSFTEKT